MNSGRQSSSALALEKKLNNFISRGTLSIHISIATNSLNLLRTAANPICPPETLILFIHPYPILIITFFLSLNPAATYTHIYSHYPAGCPPGREREPRTPSSPIHAIYTTHRAANKQAPALSNQLSFYIRMAN